MEGILLLALYFLLGLAVVKLGFLKSHEFHGFAQFVYFVCLPSAILSNIPKPSEIAAFANLALLALVPLFLVGAVIIALYKAGRIPKESFGAILIASLFGNIVYLGIPVSQDYFPGTVGPMSILIIVTNVVMFGLAIPLVQSAHGSKIEIGKNTVKIATNPVLASSFAALALLAGGLDASALSGFLAPLSAMTVPLSLVAMGMFAAHSNGFTFGKEVQQMLAFKHLALPAATLACVWILRPDATISGLALLSSSMSPAVACFSIVVALGIGKRREVASAILAGILLMFAEIWLIFGFRW